METAASIFQIDGARPTTAIVGFGEDRPDVEPDWPDMLLQLQGAADVLDTKQIAKLLSSPVPRQPATTWTDATRRVWVVHLHSAKSDTWKRVEIGRDDTGVVLARDVDGPRDRPMAIELDRVRCAELAWRWPLRNADPALKETNTPQHDRDAPVPGRVTSMDQPLVSAWTVLNEEQSKERVGGGRLVVFTPLERDLDEEELFVRLPNRYSPDKPAGVIVWIDAVDAGPPRDELFAAADELNLICVSAANVGNIRPPVARCQLALDAVHNVRMRLAVDQDRIYTAGISGGARMATIMTQCFPDIFAGSVADVALSSYIASSAGNGLYWRAEFGRPARPMLALLKDRRIAGITGERDGNYASMKARERDMNKDGLNVRLFEHDMGHEMCTSDQFAQAMRWVDERVQLDRQKKMEDAAQAMASYEQMVLRPRFDQTAANRQLARVIDLVPWTEPAWKACEIVLDQRIAR